MEVSEVEQFILNSNPRFIIGLVGAGFFFAWISEFIFSLFALFREWAIKKIRDYVKTKKGENTDV